MADEASGRWMKAALPALGAAVLIGALVVFARGGGPAPAPAPAETATAPVPPSAAASSATVAPLPPTASVVPAITASAPPTVASAEPAPSSSVGLPVDPSQMPSVAPTVVGPAPSVTPGKKWTDAEKLQKLQATMASVDQREKSLVAEIAAAEKAGNTQEAADKKVLLERTRQRKAELQKALAAGDTSGL